ncbi:cell death regulator Aven, partial [Megalops cyprinoides]|uniref:cell death regulator Aven n=1 Tax=Megalops cyprinoides TaxID=118141 RepID=UPI0018647BF8
RTRQGRLPSWERKKGTLSRQEGNDVQNKQEEEAGKFSRRKLESNWDRYEEEEKAQLKEEGPMQKGMDYHVLLGSAGDAFTQFRFSEEKDWEVESSATNQVSAVLVDLQVLAWYLQALPLHLRLNLEEELVQLTAPVELPMVIPKPKQKSCLIDQFRPPSSQSPSFSIPMKPVLGGAPLSPKPLLASSTAEPAVDDLDQELDLLLSLQAPVTDASEAPPTCAPEEELSHPDTLTQEEDPKVVLPEVDLERPGEVPSEAEATRPVATEDELEDWLDSMIS